MRKYLLLLITFIAFCSAAFAQANFNASSFSGCKPLIVNFTDASTGATTWAWEFGNSNTSSSQNPSASYSNAGTFNVKLTINKGTASENSITKTVTVFNNPTAGLTTSILTYCVGSTAIFNDASTLGSAPITLYQWDFGDGGSSNTTVNTASYIYNSAGNFPANLTVRDANGCTSSSAPINVTILAGPVANGTVTPTFSCNAPLTITTTNTSVPSSSVFSYLWEFGDGQTSTATNPSHVYATDGTYVLKLTINQPECSFTKIIQSIRVGKIVPNFTNSISTICAGKAVTFTNTSAPDLSISSWTFTGGNPSTSSTVNNIVTYPAAGTYTVKLVATDIRGCTEEVIKNNLIVVNPLPVISITVADNTSCKIPFVVNFGTNADPTGTFSWTFTGGNAVNQTTQTPVVTFTNFGTYTATLNYINSNGCSATAQKTILVVPPEAKFTATTPRQGCAPLPVAFQSTSISPVDPIVSYTWSFPGSGVIAPNTTGLTPALTYTNTGSYTVTLQIETESGCVASLTRVNYVKAGMITTGDFVSNINEICYSSTSAPITFTPNYAGADVDSVNWIFESGSPATKATNILAEIYGPQVVNYTVDTGRVDVTLEVFDRGCKTIIKKEDYILVKPPKTKYTLTNVDCDNKLFREFNNTSAGADSIIWYFDTSIINSLTVDASNINTLTANYTYPARGTYNFKVVTFNYETGCKDSIMASLRVTIPDAELDVIPPEGCYPAAINFDDNSIDASSVSYLFGDGNSLISVAPNSISTHTYLVNGTYIATTTIVDMYNCPNTTTKSIEVYGPIANFTANKITGCAPLVVEFTDISTLTYPATSWTWDFNNDGTVDETTTSSTLMHTFTNVGSYTVRMSITDEKGCTKLSPTLLITPTFPKPNFAVSDTFICPGSTIDVNAILSQSYLGSYTWDFRDGNINSDNFVTTTNTFTSEGNYDIKLTLTDGNGCVDSTFKMIKVRSPHADFSFTREVDCGYTKASFTDNSPDQEYVQSWYWQLGDGGISRLQNPVKNYNKPGEYTVTFVVKNIAGCTDTIVKSNAVVVPGPYGSYTYNPLDGCSPLTVNFTGVSPNTLIYSWDFGDGEIIENNNTSGVDTITHVYIDEIVAKPILFLINKEDVNGNILECTTALEPKDSIVVKNFIFADAQPAYTALKEDSVLQINTAATGFQNNNFYYRWSPSEFLSCTDCPNPTITGNGDKKSYTYVVNVTDERGCGTNDTIRIEMPGCSGDDAILIPNVITPNGDYINDYFELKGWCDDRVFDFIIFNRWGNIVYQTTDIKAYWEGKNMAGEELPEGVYFYLLKYDDFTNKGTIQILR